jgi:hypothetical protein
MSERTRDVERRLGLRPEPTYTRDGFPWPTEMLVFHGTAAVSAIRREGFKTRRQGAGAAAGGNWKDSVSFTLDVRRAAAIALGLDVFRRAARHEIGCEEILDRTKAELGNDQGIRSGYNLQSLVFLAAAQGLEPDRWLRHVMRRLDQGWTWGACYRSPVTPDVPGLETIRDPEDGSAIGWLYPPGTPLPSQPIGNASWKHGDAYLHDRVDVAAHTYVSALNMAMGAAFNPRFVSPDVRRLADRGPDDVGILVCRIRITRVVPDDGGAVQLGFYADRPPYGEAQYVNEWMYDVQAALGAQSEYDVERGKKPLKSRWGYGPDALGSPDRWKVMDEGDRTRESTMLYHAREEEIIVYAPHKVEVVDFWDMAEIRRRFALGDRLTFPPFEDLSQDVPVFQAVADWSRP